MIAGDYRCTRETATEIYVVHNQDGVKNHGAPVLAWVPKTALENESSVKKIADSGELRVTDVWASSEKWDIRSNGT